MGVRLTFHTGQPVTSTRYDQTRFTMRINSELLERIKIEAEKNKRSAAKEIEYILEKHINTLPKDAP